MGGCPLFPVVENYDFEGALNEIKAGINDLRNVVENFAKKNLPAEDRMQQAELSDTLDDLDQKLKWMLGAINRETLPSELKEEVTFLIYDVTDLRAKYVVEAVDMKDCTILIE